jgi:predicted GNAT superfamily acetyltransferase
VAGSEKVIEIRQLHERREFEDAVGLQKTIWGFSDVDLLPVRFFVVANKVGGHSFGAYDGTRMVGFCLGIPGLKPGGHYYIHGHMLGVLAGYRDYGIGRRMKLAQRDEALSRGIELIEWTFDPLEIKNAFFNMERLGAVVKRYVENQYGITSSALHGGLPTDRCIAEWRIASPRVAAVLEGHPLEREIVDRIEFPADIEHIRRHDPKRARAIQKANGEKFQRLFAEGLAVIGFERSETSGTYLIGPLSA